MRPCSGREASGWPPSARDALASAARGGPLIWRIGLVVLSIDATEFRARLSLLLEEVLGGTEVSDRASVVLSRDGYVPDLGRAAVVDE